MSMRWSSAHMVMFGPPGKFRKVKTMDNPKFKVGEKIKVMRIPIYSDSDGTFREYWKVVEEVIVTARGNVMVRFKKVEGCFRVSKTDQYMSRIWPTPMKYLVMERTEK